ncbi:MAG: 2'-5' RNA ligase family protein [Deltaproteobacteria bacterium]
MASKLKAVVVLLPEVSLQNRARESVLRLHRAHNDRLRWVAQPPHVSLKQPFALESLSEVERYFDGLAARAPAIHTRLGPVEVQPPPPDAADSIVWVSVLETELLRRLHEQINEELKAVVADPSAPFDGAGYRFHMTLGFLAEQPSSSWIPPELSLVVGEVVTFSEIALFVYDGLPEPGWQGMTYKVLPLRSSDRLR